MCGRYTLTEPGNVASFFGLGSMPRIEPRYNIAPTQDVPALRVRDGRRSLDMLHWGLVPFWAKEPSIGNRMINARAESAAEKPAFREAMRYRRCLLPANGFYEWRKVGRGKQPYWIRPTDRPLFAFAGLWERWQDPQGEPLESCTILTVDANDALAEIHPRMPATVQPEDFDRWLDPQATDADAVRDAIGQYPTDHVQATAVNRRVNSPHNDDPACVEPVDGRQDVNSLP